MKNLSGGSELPLEKVGLRENFPEFKVKRINAGQAKVTCKGCKLTHTVDYAMWLDYVEGQTRPCPYCFKTSKVPEE